jgi:hypothetical protein
MSRATTLQLTLLLVTGIPLVSAQAQTIYRCGSNYSQSPCEGAVEVKADDVRSAAQKAESEKVFARDGRTANTLEKARLNEEKERAAYEAKLRQTEQAAAKKALAAQQKASASVNASKKSASAAKGGKSASEPFIAKSASTGK